MSETKSPVISSGVAKDVKNAPPLGLIDIGENQRAYIFRVSLPGVRLPQCNVTVDIHVDGRVEIKGVVQESEFVNKHAGEKYKEQKTQKAFNVNFNLPGRVDPRLTSPTFRNNGILEVVVLKHTISPISQKIKSSGTPVAASV